MTRALLFFALCGLVACAPSEPAHAPPPVAPPEPSRIVEPPPNPIPPLPEPRRIAVRLVWDERGIHLRVAASGPAADLGQWKMPEDTMSEVAVEDGIGVAKPFVRENGVIEVSAPRPQVTVVYDVTPAASDDDVKKTIVEPARLRALGEKILALPIAFDNERVEATIVIDAHAIDPPMTASTFGVGPARIRHVIRTTGAELRRIAFIGGGGGHAVFDTPEGHDEAAWLGYTAFDPRTVAAEVAAFRTFLHDVLRGLGQDSHTILFVADDRPRGRFRVTRRAGGMLVNVGGKDPYDAWLRLAVGHELAHVWIGDRIWVGGDDAYWFQEGFARWTSREELARGGLLSPDDLAAEIDRLLSIVTTTPKDKPTFALAVARGALFATILDGRIREKSHGDKALEDLLRALLQSNESMNVKLTEAAFLDEAAKWGGDVVKTDFDDVVRTGKRITLPADAIGGCFETRDVAYETIDPGFDVAASRTSARITNLDPKGPAARAGLVDQETLVRSDDPVDPKEKMNVVVTRGGQDVTVAFEPKGPAKKGQAFRRRPHLSDEACKKLALRK